MTLHAFNSCCYIREVKTGYAPPVHAEIVTDLSEHLPVFDVELVRIAQIARDEHRPVYLTVHRTGRRHRYVSEIHLMIAEMSSRSWSSELLLSVREDDPA